LRIVIWPEASKAQNNIAAVFAEGGGVWGLDRPPKLFVESVDCIRRADRFPLAFDEAANAGPLPLSLL
jgi:hypothetical protein